VQLAFFEGLEAISIGTQGQTACGKVFSTQAREAKVSEIRLKPDVTYFAHLCFGFDTAEAQILVNMNILDEEIARGKTCVAPLGLEL
jgi:hypothetical protein